VYKKGAMLRLDYHLDSIEQYGMGNNNNYNNSSNNKHFSLLLKVNQ
jgi:hypothetical protein